LTAVASVDSADQVLGSGARRTSQTGRLCRGLCRWSVVRGHHQLVVWWWSPNTRSSHWRRQDVTFII